jgi:hypothetical protein
MNDSGRRSDLFRRGGVSALLDFDSVTCFGRVSMNNPD